MCGKATASPTPKGAASADAASPAMRRKYTLIQLIDELSELRDMAGDEPNYTPGQYLHRSISANYLHVFCF